MAANSKPSFLFENRFSDGTPTATDTASGDYDVLNIQDGRNYKLHRFLSAGTVYYTIDCGVGIAADTLCIINHNMYRTGGADATVSVEYSSDNFVADVNEALAGFTPDVKAFAKTFTTQSARYWRVKIVSIATTVYAGEVMLGRRVTMQRYPESGFDPDSEKIVAESNKSLGGNPLGSVIKHYEREISMNFRKITPSWITNTFKTFWDTYLKQLKAGFVMWDLTNHADEVYYGKLPDKFTLSMPYDPVRRSLRLKFDTVVEDD